ncbi:MAG: hypothetical protein V3V03_05820 [Hyphomonadaceae bacterium]
MAKALFHKNQRVFVKPVATWAQVEKVIPHWVKDVEQPLRVTYDVGLGRDFTAGELVSETVMRGHDRQQDDEDMMLENWRIFRVKGRWQNTDDQSGHPYPGTFPVVMTDDNDWGGWRVPSAEYDRDPLRIEHQSRMIMNAPDMLAVVKALVTFVSEEPENAPTELIELAKRCSSIMRHVYEVPEELPETVVAAE